MAKEKGSAVGHYYLSVRGETVGPLPLETIEIMLEQNRIGFADFVWKKGLEDWARLLELDEFSHLLPELPQRPIPPKEGGGERPVQGPRRPQQPKKIRPTSQIRSELSPEEINSDVTSQPPQVESELERESQSYKNPKSRIKDTQVAGQANQPVKQKTQKSWPKVRYFPRVEIDAILEIEGHGSFKVDNISVGGVRLKASHPIAIGTELRFTLKATPFEKALEMTGIVIRENESSEIKGFSVEFTRVNPAHRRLIKQYVASADEE